MDKQEAAAKSAAASFNFISSDLYKQANVIMLYMPIGNETDTADIIKQAFVDGKKVLVPVTHPETGEITACIITEETCFAKGAFSVNEPVSGEKATQTEVEVVIVPGIVFDKKGGRIGFGKGCYDRFLNSCSAVKIGFCYEFQVAEEIPTEEHDVKMDYIITENRITKC